MSDRLYQLYKSNWKDPAQVYAEASAKEMEERARRCQQLTDKWMNNMANAFHKGKLETSDIDYTRPSTYKEADFQCAVTKIRSIRGASVNIGPWTTGELGDCSWRRVELKYKPD